MKTYLFISILLFNAFDFSAQIKTSEFEMAEEFFKNESYSEAIPHLLTLLQKDSLNVSLNFKAGICYLHSRSQKNKSVNYFERALVFGNTTYLSENAYELMGDSYYLNQLFDLAISSYEKYQLVILSKDHCYSDVADRIKWKIAMCELSKKVSAGPSLYTHNANFSSDQSQLTFTFYQNTAAQEDTYYKKFYNSDTTTKIEIADDSIIKIIQNEATVATTSDAQHILTYRNDEGTANLYIANLSDSKWSTPQKLDKRINDAGWEQGEFISADNNTLYFISSREGGFGGTDIYKCERNSNGEWGKATNLGPEINTCYDEEAPFMHQNNKVLYFSSNRQTHNRIFDIFTSSSLQDRSWTRTVKVGYPSKIIESENGDSDFEMILAEKGKGLITFIDDDASKFIVITGIPTSSIGKISENIYIEASNNHTGENIGRYISKNKFSFLLPANINTNITYHADGFIFYSENIDMIKNNAKIENRKIRNFIPYYPGSVTELRNIFFEDDKAILLESSSMELKRLVELLTSHRTAVIELSGYINSDGNKIYNARLSQERVRIIAEYLISKGINKDQLVTNNHGQSIKSRPKQEKTEESAVLNGDQVIELKILETETKKKQLQPNKYNLLIKQSK